jgi:hypothetical protein
MNCWGIRIYFTESRFSLNGGLFVSMELLLGHQKIIPKSGISLNAGTLNLDHYLKTPTGCTFSSKQLYSSLKHFNKTRHMFRLLTEPSSGGFLSLKLHIFRNIYSLVHFVNTVLPHSLLLMCTVTLCVYKVNQ